MRSAIDLIFAFARCLHVDNAVRSTGSKLMRKIYPQDTRNSETLMVANVLALLKNSAIGRHSIQLS